MAKSSSKVETGALHYRIDSVQAGTNGVGKIVNLRWFTRRVGPDDEAVEVPLLQDQIGVGARATDEEILRAVEDRRAQVSPQLAYQVPNPEANKALVGHEG